MIGTGSMVLCFLVVLQLSALIVRASPINDKYSEITSPISDNHNEMQSPVKKKDKEIQSPINEKHKEIKLLPEVPLYEIPADIVSPQALRHWLHKHARGKPRPRRLINNKRPIGANLPPRRGRDDYCAQEARYADCFLCGKMADDARVFHGCCAGEEPVSDFCQRLLY